MDALADILDGQRNSQPLLKPLIKQTLEALQEKRKAARTAGRPYQTTYGPHAYASDALKCSRQVALKSLFAGDLLPVIDGRVIEPKEEMGLQGLIATYLGTEFHELIQNAMLASGRYEGLAVEVYWSLGFLSGYADGFYIDPSGRRTILEIKTQSRWRFQKADTAGEPFDDDVMQAMLSAYALNAEQIHLVYIAKEGSGRNGPLREFFVDYDYEKIKPEIDRLSSLVYNAKHGKLPDRYLPEERRVVADPEDEYWPCAFCPVMDICKVLGSGEVEISLVEAETK